MTAFGVAQMIADAMRERGAYRIPRDTGLLQDRSINALSLTRKTAVVDIGGEKGALAYYVVFLEFSAIVGRSDTINKHQGFIEDTIEKTVIPMLKERL